MEQSIFAVFAMGVIGFLLWKTVKTSAKRFPTMLIGVTLVFGAVYLFMSGRLDSFTFKALSAEATFIRNKKQEVQQDAVAITELRTKIEQHSKELESLLVQARETNKKMEESEQFFLKFRADALKIETDMVLITFYSLSGANQFPNPFVGEMNKLLDSMTEMILPSESERARLIAETTARRDAILAGRGAAQQGTAPKQ